MSRPTTLRASRSTIVLNKVKTFFSKPHNVILLLLGIVLTFTTVAPIVAIVEDTFKIHAGTIDAHLTGQASGYTIGACAAVTILVTQAILNVFGTVDILPLTGVTFPFVSNGGSSMLCVWGLLAFVKAADTRQNASFAIRLPGRKGA